MKTWLTRIRRVFRLDPEVFEEVEHDYSAGPQALAVVLVVSTCGSVGNLMAATIVGLEFRPWPSLFMMVAGFVVSWIVWSFVTMAIGTTCFGGSADMGEMQRTLGFAAAPGLLMLIPGVGLLVGLPWSLMAMVVAVRQALDFDTRRAILTVLTGSLVMSFVVLPAGCYLKGRGMTASVSMSTPSSPPLPSAPTDEGPKERPHE